MGQKIEITLQTFDVSFSELYICSNLYSAYPVHIGGMSPCSPECIQHPNMDHRTHNLVHRVDARRTREGPFSHCWRDCEIWFRFGETIAHSGLKAA